jgi:hypothetical protein
MDAMEDMAPCKVMGGNISALMRCLEATETFFLSSCLPHPLHYLEKY